MKTQLVRVVDVVLLGPFMLWSARFLPRPWDTVMRVSAVATIVYNARNWARVEARRKGR